MLKRAVSAAVLFLALALSQSAVAWTHGSSASNVPVPGVAAVRCTLAGTYNGVAAGDCLGTGGGTALFTAGTCDGAADDSPAFTSWNAWARNWQLTHTGLVELDVESGKTCEFISGNVSNNGNTPGAGILSFQLIAYGVTFGDNHGTGGGFFLGTGSASGIKFNGTSSTARIATVSAGSTSITLLDTSKCSLFNNGDPALVAGIDVEGFGDPPSPPIFDYIEISSVALCPTTGRIDFTTPLAYEYKSTWPLYNSGNAFQSDQGGPATLYQLTPAWGATHAYFGLTTDQSDQISVSGKNITLVDMSAPGGSCVIPSETLNYNIYNGSFANCNNEVDKIVGNAYWQNVTYHQVKFQQRSPLNNWTCINCVVTSSIQGTPGPTTFVGGNVADLQLGPIVAGAGGGFSATNTVISSLEAAGVSMSNIDTRGVWSSTGLTVPSNVNATAAASCGANCTSFAVPSTAGWSSGITVDFLGTPGSCADTYHGTWTVTVVDGTHLSIPVPFTTTCTGPIGALPFAWVVPRANVYFSGSKGGSVGPMLQVADVAVGANNETIISFNQNGSPYTGGLPTMSSGPPFSLNVHPAPSWSCTNCTGAINVLDVTNVPAGPFGSQATRVVTAANSGSAIPMPAFGALTELDMTVTAACGGASNVGFEQTMFTATLGSSSSGTWNPTANAAIASAIPRKVTPTTHSGDQSGDSLVTPGANTLLLYGQALPFYSNVGNCPSASTTITLKTDQGVVP